MATWPSGIRPNVKAVVRKGASSNLAVVKGTTPNFFIIFGELFYRRAGYESFSVLTNNGAYCRYSGAVNSSARFCGIEKDFCTVSKVLSS